MKRKKISGTKYIAAFSLATLIFIVGIFLGNYISQIGITSLKESQEELRAQLLGLDLRDKLIAFQDVCEVPIREIWEDKVYLGRQVELLEKTLGKLNEDVLRQKELYELIEIKTWLLLKERKAACDEDYSVILFFYTNRGQSVKGSVKQSEDQGIILSALYSKYPEEINTFAFDINTDNVALNTLRELYGITHAPSLVINEEVYGRFVGLYEVKEIVGLEE